MFHRGFDLLNTRERDLLGLFLAECSAIDRQTMTAQVEKAKFVLRSRDEMLTKIGYRRKRRSKAVPRLRLNCEESIVGRVVFDGSEYQDWQVVQIGGLCSAFEFFRPPTGIPIPGIREIQTLLTPHEDVSSTTVAAALQRKLSFLGDRIEDARAPAPESHIRAAATARKMIPPDYFQLCACADGFKASGVEFLGLRFRSVTFERDRACVFLSQGPPFRGIAAVASNASQADAHLVEYRVDTATDKVEVLCEYPFSFVEALQCFLATLRT